MKGLYFVMLKHDDEIAPMITGGFGRNRVMLFKTEDDAEKAAIESELVSKDDFIVFKLPEE